MPLSASIDQTEALANSQARALDTRAPALQDGEVVTAAHVRQAQREHKRRKLINEAGAGASADEVSASKIRMRAVEIAAAFEAHGDSLRGGPITQADLDRQTETLTASLTASFSAALTAESARRYNTIILQGVEPSKSTTKFRRIPKTVPHLMPGRVIVTPNVPQNPPVGARCPASLFPQNLAALNALNTQQLEDLMTWYNNDFDVQEDDSIEQRRAKFLDFLQWG